MRVLSFLGYYCKLRIRALLGRHRTPRPLGVRFRWQVWNYRQHVKRVQDRDWSAR